jgi:amino acid adenylation domain-containing protein/non-ribosomal peptide synthase protein (TIGR01720 family)
MTNKNQNLIQILCEHVRLQADQEAFQFLQQGEIIRDSLSYADLDQRARMIAVHLKQQQVSGEPVLLLYPAGLEFLCAFMGCLYAGAIAVPAYPPSRRHAKRLAAIIADADPKVILCDTEQSLVLAQLEGVIPSIAHIPKLVSETLLQNSASEWVMPDINAGTLAFLQYTSGSTGDPKGVMVSHGNLMVNLASLSSVFLHPDQAPYVSWLPLYHDMGLIGVCLRALYIGTPVILMSPSAFMEKPVRWLRAISKYRAHYSGGPNFAYDLCVKKITADQCEGLDLSHWQIAFNGAEPIRSKTLSQFTKMFEPYGFSKKAFWSCYGMAETTLFISGSVDRQSPASHCFDAEALAHRQVRIASQQTVQSTSLVSCGITRHKEKIVIVNPNTGKLCKKNEVGEIWVQGSSIAKGYWKKPQLTQKIFEAKLSAKDRHHFLRTGDLGFFHQQQLYHAGRLKDIIIIRGRNIYPQDIEQSIDEQVETVRAGATAVFSFESEEGETVVIVCELTRQTFRLEIEAQWAIAAQIRRVVSQSFELKPWAVILVAPATVPKTSSGKIRRSACKQQWLDDQLRIVLEDSLQKQAQQIQNNEPVNQEHILLKQILASSNTLQKQTLLLQFFKVHLASSLNCATDEIDGQNSLVEMGLDSLRNVELKHVLDMLLDRDIPLQELMSDLPLVSLVKKLVEHYEPEIHIDERPVSFCEKGRFPLSAGQTAIWFVHQQQSQSIAYNIHLALHIHSQVDSNLLQKSLGLIMQRHLVLRTAYGEHDGIPYQTINSDIPACFSVIDAKGWKDDRLQHAIYSVISTPFNLNAGKVLRARLLLQDNSNSILLICAHHIALDFWSLSLIVQELGDLYSAKAGVNSIVKASGAACSDFVHWQQNMLVRDEDQHWRYWSQQLKGELTQVNLPFDYPKVSEQQFSGASQALDISPVITASLKTFSQQHQTTLFVTLLSAFSALLYRYSGQQDMIIGIPTSGRSQKQFANTVGYFVNPVAMRFKPHGTLPFHQLVEQTRINLLAALEHQDYPFSTVVERLNPEREADRWPLYQLAFTLQTSQLAGQQDLAALALGESGVSMRWGELEVESLAIDKRIENFDLKLIMAETCEGLLASFQYNSDLFETDTIRAMANHFQQLLISIVEQPKRVLSDLKMLSRDEYRQQTEYTQQDKAVAPRCIHVEFEHQAQIQPDARAIQSAQVSLTYKQLDERANQVAHCLQASGAGPESIIALYMPRCTDFVIAMLAVIKTGAAYLPLDTSSPSARMQDMLADAEVTAIISCESLGPQLSAFDYQLILLDRDKIMLNAYPCTTVSTHVKLDNTAYLIYTSGSSGKPKGVSVSHRALGNLVSWHQREYQLSSQDRASQIAGLGFDASVWEIWPYLSAGASLHIVDDNTRLNSELLLNWLKEQEITHCFLPTPLAEVVLQTSWPKSMLLKALLTGGDRLGSVSNKQQVVDLYNHYGPTESAVVSSFTKVNWNDESLPAIGHAIDNIQLYILDTALNPIPRGCEGDLYIAGDSLARGYHNQPGLTAEHFIPNPFSDAGTRMYRSGDRARYRQNGEIEFCGRNDQQVKVRGFRVEPAEIECLLEQLSGVKTSAVLMQENGADEQQLTAYIVPKQARVSSIDVGSEMELDHIESWTALYENTYQSSKNTGDFDITGWNSSYTDNPIPANEMQQWVDNTVAAIIADNPRRILEIGCGTGLLLTRLATACDSYYATDISPTALSQLATTLKHKGIEHVTLKCQAADTEFFNLDQAIDTVIVNSVVQYFPNIDYFFSMLDQVLPTIASDGKLFIGDVRSYALSELFHTDVQTHRAKSSLSLVELNKAIAISASTDHELLIAPEFFMALKQRYSDISYVEICHKKGNYDNELSCYRYDVVLHIKSHLQAKKMRWSKWSEFADIDALHQQLVGQQPDNLAIRGIPNVRLSRAVMLSKTLLGAQPTTIAKVSELRSQLDQSKLTGIDPYVLEMLAEELGYHADFLVSKQGDHGLFDLVLRNKSSNADAIQLDMDWTVFDEKRSKDFANDPLHSRRLNSWIPLLRESLSQHLPDYMIPQAFVFLDQIPITANGKLDRKALPLPEITLSSNQHIEARNKTECILINIWQQLLGVAKIGIQDNFFELGGDSILSIQVVSCARSSGIKISSRDIFEHQTIENLAIKIDKSELKHSSKAKSQNNSLATTYSVDQRNALEARFGDIEAIYPLSPLQIGLWFQNQFDSEQSVYIEQLCFQLQGKLDVEALRKAWNFIQTRHAVLRTGFDWLDAEQAVQVVVKAEQMAVPFYQMDWRALTAEAQDIQFKSFLAQDYRQGFNSSQAPLMRVSIIRISDQQCHMVWTHHHLLLDGWSVPLLLAELFKAYQNFALGESLDFPMPPAYSDYINWLAERDQNSAKQYWQQALSGFNTPVLLQNPSAENIKASAMESMQRNSFSWDKPFTKQLQSFCRQQHVTLNTLLQGAWALVLSAHTERKDVLFGIVESGRQQPLENIENMVGLLINSLPLRIKLNPGQSTSEWLQALQIQTLELGEYSYSALPDIQRWSDCSAQAPLFDILMAFENYPLSDIRNSCYADLCLTDVSYQDQTHYPLTIVITPSECLGFTMSYDNQRFNKMGIERLAQHFKTVVSQLLADPQKQLSMFTLLNKQERSVIERFSQENSSYPVTQTIAQRFEQQAEANSNAVALVFEGQKLSYKELDRQANQLANAMIEKGIQASDRVAICLERSIQSAVAMLAVLKAGATYVPLDPYYPAQRLVYTIKDAKVALLIVDKDDNWHQNVRIAILALNTGSLEQFDTQTPATCINPQWPAYIIYTSGSTGKPKGVSVSHAHVMRLFSACAEYIDFKSSDVWSLFHSSAFDFSVWELWGALLQGASCVIVPYWVSRSPQDFQKLIEDRGITILSQTPSAFYPLQKEIVNSNLPVTKLRYVVFGGEALDPARLAPWFEQFGDHSPQLINMYGITETTVHVTAYRVSQQDAKTSVSNIGVAISDLSTWVLNSRWQPVPVGVMGELYVGGAGVSQGYIRHARLNAERFIPDPLSTQAGARLYRTGDLVRYCENGTLEYHGRGDNQIQLHGHRIEMGEIEHALIQHAVIEASAVILTDGQLIAYWVGEQTDSEILKTTLAEQLPAYMVPQSLIRLDVLPLTINGKLDYEALPAPDQPVLTENVLAETEIESLLLGIWCELLKLEKIGVSDNFFELGGDSILSMQVVNHAHHQGIKISPKQIFEHQDIRSLARVAERIESIVTDDFNSTGKVTGTVPLTPIQCWFFEQPLKNFNHWNQTILLTMPEARNIEIFQRALLAVTEYHDSFSLRFLQQGTGWQQVYKEQSEPAYFKFIDLSEYDEYQQKQAVASHCQFAQKNLDIELGPVFRALYFRCTPLQSDQLLLSGHHLIIDGVSWRILLEDLELAYQQLSSQPEVKLAQKTHSFKQWSEQLFTYTSGETLQNERAYWLGLPWDTAAPLSYDQPLAGNLEGDVATIHGQLNRQETQHLLKNISSVYSTQINDLLLTALAQCLLPETGGAVIHIDIEGHGREQIFADLDISRTIGWFTTQYPVLLSLSGQSIGEDIKKVKELLRKIPQKGIGFGLLRHLDEAEKCNQFSQLPKARVCFNYLGQFDASWADSSPLFATPDSFASQIGEQHATDNPRHYDIDINAVVVDGELFIHWACSPRYSKQSIEKLANAYLQALRNLITHCLSPEAGGFSPSDFPLADQLDQQALDQLLNGL